MKSWSEWFAEDRPPKQSISDRPETPIKEREILRKVFENVVVEGDDWVPNDKEKAAAWELYVELRTRISSQPLHFLSGDEVTALASLYSLFQTIRDQQKKHGADAFYVASFTNVILNSVIRPVTSRWHKRKLEGKLTLEDPRREFRKQLNRVRGYVTEFQLLLLRIACASDRDTAGDELDLISKQRTVELGGPIPFDRLLGLTGTQKNASEILAAEQQEIRDLRQARGDVREQDKKSPEDLVGLALSGGGIRSSTFGLGVLQGLSRRGVLQEVDVMSTVSGGGYLGSFISTFLNTESPECGLSSDKAPFKPDIANDSKAIRSLRNNSRYMQPAGFKRWAQAVGQVAYGIASNLILLSFVVFLAVIASHYAWGLRLRAYHGLVHAKDVQPLPTQSWSLNAYTGGCVIFFGLTLFLLPLVQRILRARGKSQSRVNGWEQMTISALVVAVVVVLIDYLPNFHYYYMRVMREVGELIPGDQGGANRWSVTATLVAIANGIGLLIARAQWLRKLMISFPVIGRALFGLLWLCGPILFSYAYFELTRVYIAAPNPDFTFAGFSMPAHCFIWLLAAGSFVYSFWCNINFTSLHRFYRNRLAETFLLRASEAGEPQEAPAFKLSQLRCPEQPDAKQPSGAEKKQTTPQPSRCPAPYHILNAALNLPASKIDELRGRDCDFFIFSKHYCGSPVIGYHATKSWEDADSHLDLGTAMAISGAAAAPQMGVVSYKGASFLLTLLNVRMGYWLRRPFRENEKYTGLRKLLGGPGPRHLTREARNVAGHKDPYLNLTDGGHVENLGIYELLRRRCKYVIAIDGECDPDLNFPSLRQLQRFATVDLGVEVDIVVDRIAWIPLEPVVKAPDAASEQPAASVRPPEVRYSRGHFAVGRINYPPNDDGTAVPPGWMVYIKLSVTGNEPHQVADYRRRNPDAPHQTTMDQVFEEDQFEAYRSLGEHVADDLFAADFFPGRSGNNQSFTVNEWFSAIANAMYEPTG